MRLVTGKSERPLYLKIYDRVKGDIINGAFAFNSRLPSKRLLAEESGVSVITVERAYALLCDEGYVEARERSGYFVIFRSSDGFAYTSDGSCRQRAESKQLATDYPSFSADALGKTVRRVLADYGDEILEKSPNSGDFRLKNALKRYLARNREIRVDEEQIVIGSGAEYLYGLCIMLLGRDKTFAIETPSYDKIEQIYRSAGVRWESLPLNRDGIDSTSLALSNADVLHITPYKSFPSGVTASASKRHEYIRWAAKEGRFIIESDYGSEFSLASQPVETLFSISNCDNVIYLNTFSKTLSPSMRAGYMVLPKKLVGQFETKLGFYSCTVPTLEQLIIAELINDGSFERHINRVRRMLRKKQENH